MWRYAFVIYESIIQEIAGFVKVGGDTYLLREDRAGDECQDYYDNCFYKKEGDQLTKNINNYKLQRGYF